MLDEGRRENEKGEGRHIPSHAVGNRRNIKK